MATLLHTRALVAALFALLMVLKPAVAGTPFDLTIARENTYFVEWGGNWSDDKGAHGFYYLVNDATSLRKGIPPQASIRLVERHLRGAELSVRHLYCPIQPGFLVVRRSGDAAALDITVDTTKPGCENWGGIEDESTGTYGRWSFPDSFTFSVRMSDPGYLQVIDSTRTRELDGYDSRLICRMERGVGFSGITLELDGAPWPAEGRPAALDSSISWVGRDVCNVIWQTPPAQSN